MRRDWEPEELIDFWTLVDDDWTLVANKSGPTRLGFAALLKFFELEGRFPRHGGEVPKPALGYLASQLKVQAVRSPTTGGRAARSSITWPATPWASRGHRG